MNRIQTMSRNCCYKRRFINPDTEQPWTDSMKAFAKEIKKHFKHQPRNWQMHAIEGLRQHHDVLVRAGTGSGKSLVFQAMALSHSKAIVLVISPLLSLMENHVSRFL